MSPDISLFMFIEGCLAAFLKVKVFVNICVIYHIVYIFYMVSVNLTFFVKCILFSIYKKATKSTKTIFKPLDQ